MSTYLAHHGILGQKWGIRRYQNKDGTLTAAGKARYAEGTVTGFDMKLFGRNVHFPIDSAYYSDDPEYVESQKLAKTASEFVKKNQERISADSYKAIVEYIRTRDADQLGSNDVDNIFKYVKPWLMHIPYGAKARDFALVFDYKFDPEHRLAVCFKDGSFAKVTDEPGAEFVSWW